MIEIINLLLDTSKGIIHKIRWVLLALLFIVLSDIVSPFPSLIFTHDKYEAIETMQRLKKDTTLTLDARKHIEYEIGDMVKRNSLRDYSNQFLSLNLNNLSRISHIIATNKMPKINSIVLNIFSVFVFIISCTFFTVLMYVLEYYSLKRRYKTNPTAFKVTLEIYKKAYINVLWVIPLVVYVYMFFFPNNDMHRILSSARFWQACYFIGWFAKDFKRLFKKDK